jgi:hypothetical protein
MRLMKVLFSEDFYDDIVVMNDKKGKAELDEGKAGNNERLWSQISDAYNESMNDDDYNSFAFIEDDHAENFITSYYLSKFEKLSWVKASKWFKETIKDYDAVMVNYSTSGTHQPDLFGYVGGKAHVYYYRL